MALLEDVEPPSPQSADKVTKKSKENKHKKQLNLKFLILAKEKCKQAFDTSTSVFTKIANFLKLLKNIVFCGKYIPHTVILILAIVVTITNISQKMTAKAYSNELVTLDPDIKYAVTDSLDYFTPLIDNDAEKIDQMLLVHEAGDGFVRGIGSVSTSITEREEPLPDNTNKLVKYTVKNGDTLTGLGWKFDIKLATLKYVNDISDADLIKPGMVLEVPKKGYEVPQYLIAQKAEKERRLAAASRNTYTRDSSSSRSTTSYVQHSAGSSRNSYPYGYCTYYVATRRYVPANWGDAKSWLYSAQRAGYSTGSSPAVGAIVVTSESWWGHVAYVESVNGNYITISEMNARGWGVTSRRTISAYGGVVRGYIY